MIRGIGIDSVKISRFDSWSQASEKRLFRVFSIEETRDCIVRGKGYDSSKLAARFAAKEAFFKALSATLVSLGKTQHTFSLLSVCALCQVAKPVWGVPTLAVDWHGIEALIKEPLPKLSVQLSVAHEGEYAMAFVVIEG
jgi:phosphopantetheine--protein transferase-like protein